jgi:hypothetical protein
MGLADSRLSVLYPDRGWLASAVRGVFTACNSGMSTRRKMLVADSLPNICLSSGDHGTGCNALRSTDLHHPAINGQQLACHELRIVAGKEQDRPDDIVGHGHSFERLQIHDAIAYHIG